MTTEIEFGRLDPLGSGPAGLFAKGWGAFPAGTIAAHRKGRYEALQKRRDDLLAQSRQFDELAAEARARGCQYMTRSYERRAHNLLNLADSAERSMEHYADATR